MSTSDLTDAEFAELDEMLATTPAPLQALDASMLDGYLAGVLVQPRLIDIEEWLPNIFDYDGGLLPDDVDAAWLARIRELVERRHQLAAVDALRVDMLGTREFRGIREAVVGG